jgi:hypothetical protein
MPAPKLWKALWEKTKGRTSYAQIRDAMPSLRRSRRTLAGRRGNVSVELSPKIPCLSITSCDRDADMALNPPTHIRPLRSRLAGV